MKVEQKLVYWCSTNKSYTSLFSRRLFLQSTAQREGLRLLLRQDRVKTFLSQLSILSGPAGRLEALTLWTSSSDIHESTTCAGKMQIRIAVCVTTKLANKLEAFKFEKNEVPPI